MSGSWKKPKFEEENRNNHRMPKRAPRTKKSITTDKYNVLISYSCILNFFSARALFSPEAKNTYVWNLGIDFLTPK